MNIQFAKSPNTSKYQKHDLFKTNHILWQNNYISMEFPHVQQVLQAPHAWFTHLPGIGTACAFGAGKVAAASKH